MKTIKELPSRQLIRMRGAATLREAAELMCDMSIGALGVNGSDYRFVGLVTERDLLWAIARGLEPETATLQDVVNDFPIVVDGPIGIDDALGQMAAGHVRHLLIREDDDLRIVSMRDLIAVQLEDPTAQSHSFASASELKRLLGSVDGL